MTRVRELRKEHGFTQACIARSLGISRDSYAKYENGKREIPTVLVIELVRLYHTSADYLLNLTDDPRPYPRTKTNKDNQQ